MTLEPLRHLFGLQAFELGTVELSRAQLTAASYYTECENDSAVIVSKTVIPAWLVDRERRVAALNAEADRS